MKILAFAASSSKNSINKALAVYAGRLSGVSELEILDINDYELPLFSIDREGELGQPELALEFYTKISEVDALIISLAEHNGTYTAAYKNLFDWTSRINTKVYQNKPVLLLASSPGQGGAANVLAQAINSAAHFGMDIKASMSIPNFYDNFDVSIGQLSNAKLDQNLKLAVQLLAS